MPGGCPTRKREQKLQPGLLEPCALKGARTVLRGRGSGDTSSLPDNWWGEKTPWHRFCQGGRGKILTDPEAGHCLASQR